MPIKRARMLLFWGLHLDPTTGMLVLATWCIANGINYIGPAETFATSRVFATLIAWGISEEYLGVAQLLDAVLIVLSLMVAWEPLRVVTGILSSILWVGFGIGLVIGGANIGLISTAGTFSVVCGLAAGLSMTQWVMIEAVP